MSEIRENKRKRQKTIHNTSNDGDNNDGYMGTEDLATTAFRAIEKEKISSSSSSFDVTTSMDVVTTLQTRLEGKTEEEIREYNMNIEKPDGMSNDFRCTAEKDNKTCGGMLLLEKCELPNCPLKLHPHLNPNHPLGNVIGRCYKCKANYHICPNPNCFKALKAPDILEKDSKNKLQRFGNHLGTHPLIPLKSQDNANNELSHSSSSSSSYSSSQVAPTYVERDSFLSELGDIDLDSLFAPAPISVPTSIKSFMLSNKEADYSELLQMLFSLEKEFLVIQENIALGHADQEKILGKFGNLIFTIHHFFPEVKASEIFENFRCTYIVNEDKAGTIQILEEIKNLIGVAEVPRIIEIATKLNESAVQPSSSLTSNQSQLPPAAYAIGLSKRVKKGCVIFTLFYDAEKLYQHLIGSNQRILPSKLPVRYVDNDVKETIYDLEVMERQILIPLSGNLERLLLSKDIISIEDSTWDEKAGLRFYSFKNKEESEIEPSAVDLNNQTIQNTNPKPSQSSSSSSLGNPFPLDNESFLDSFSLPDDWDKDIMGGSNLFSSSNENHMNVSFANQQSSNSSLSSSSLAMSLSSSLGAITSQNELVTSHGERKKLNCKKCKNELHLMICPTSNCPLKKHREQNIKQDADYLKEYCHIKGDECFCKKLNQDNYFDVIGRCIECRNHYHICPVDGCSDIVNLSTIVKEESKSQIIQFNEHLKTHNGLELRSSDTPNRKSSSKANILASWKKNLLTWGEQAFPILKKIIEHELRVLALNNEKESSIVSRILSMEKDILGENFDNELVLSKAFTLQESVENQYPIIDIHMERKEIAKYLNQSPCDKMNAIRCLERIREKIQEVDQSRIATVAVELGYLNGSSSLSLSSNQLQIVETTTADGISKDVQSG